MRTLLSKFDAFGEEYGGLIVKRAGTIFLAALVFVGVFSVKELMFPYERQVVQQVAQTPIITPKPQVTEPDQPTSGFDMDRVRKKVDEILKNKPQHDYR